jgi:hypothetical protein
MQAHPLQDEPKPQWWGECGDGCALRVIANRSHAMSELLHPLRTSFTAPYKSLAREACSPALKRLVLTYDSRSLDQPPKMILI